MSENFIEIISELNAEQYKNHQNDEGSFSYQSNGYVDLIYFDKILLWSSEMDERVYINGNEHEPFTPFLKREYNRIVTRLYSMRFKRVLKQPREEDLDDN